jgi:hypothetical protein
VEIRVLREKSTPEENESSEAKTPEARTAEVNHGHRSEKDTHQQIMDFRETSKGKEESLTKVIRSSKR